MSDGKGFPFTQPVNCEFQALIIVGFYYGLINFLKFEVHWLKFKVDF